MAKRKPLDLRELQDAANTYAREAFASAPLHLGSLNADEFNAAAGAIVEALVRAWAAGFAAGRAS